VIDAITERKSKITIIHKETGVEITILIQPKIIFNHTNINIAESPNLR
jgi:hypothetical protein